jgi:hypothetical protein
MVEQQTLHTLEAGSRDHGNHWQARINTMGPPINPDADLLSSHVYNDLNFSVTALVFGAASHLSETPKALLKETHLHLRRSVFAYAK